MTQSTPVLVAAFTVALALHAVAAQAPADWVAEDAAVNPAAWEFLRAADAGDAGRAYALTTADYRAASSPEAFKKEMDLLRANVDLKKLMKLQILASPPADDRPRRAMAVWPTHLKADATADPKADPKADPRRVTLVLHLACEQGAWHVENAALDEGAEFVRAFKEANPGAGPVQSGFDGRMAIEAVVTAVGEKTLTVRPVNSWQSAPRPAERTFALDAGTGVFVPEYSRDQELPGGRTFPVYKAVPGGRDDLKVGQRVFVEWPPREARAARVSISAHANENGRR